MNICLCRDIQRADPRRHFKGCPLRKPLPDEVQATANEADANQRVEQLIDELVQMADKAGESVDKSSKIRPSTRDEARHSAFIEAIALVRRYFPPPTVRKPG